MFTTHLLRQRTFLYVIGQAPLNAYIEWLDMIQIYYREVSI